jgi:hypothetical protein
MDTKAGRIVGKIEKQDEAGEMHYGTGSHPEHGDVEFAYSVKKGAEKGKVKPEHITLKSAAVRDDVHVSPADLDKSDASHFKKLAADHHNSGKPTDKVRWEK